MNSYLFNRPVASFFPTFVARSGRLDSLEKTLAETKSQQSRDLADGPAGRLSKWLWVMAPGDCG